MQGYLAAATAVSISCVYLGLVVVQGSSRRNTRRLFFLMCCSLAWFLFCAGLSVSGKNRDGVVFWYRLSALGFAPFYAFNLHFYINLVYGPGMRRREILLYLPVPFILTATLVSRSLFQDFVMMNGHWRFFPAYDSPWFWVYFLYYFPFTASTVFLIFRRARRTGLKRHKKQAVFVSLFTLMTLVIGSSTDFLLPVMDIYTLPPLGPLTVSFYIIGLWFVLMRFGFPEQSSRAVADMIIENIEEMVFLLDSDFRILRINQTGRTRFSMETVDPDYSFFRLTANPEQNRESFNHFRHGDAGFERIKLEYYGKNQKIFGETFLSKLKDVFGDITGYLVIIRENKGLQDFINTFRITARELQVIDLCLSGQSNIRISGRLGISERTVETHLTNIFNKTITNNRIELFSLAGKYGISGS